MDSKRQMGLGARTVLLGGGHTEATRWSAWNAPKDGMQLGSQFGAQSAPAVMLGSGAASWLRMMQLHAETALPENSLQFLGQARVPRA